MSEHQADAFRLRCDEAGRVVIEFGLAAAAAPGTPMDPSRSFVARDRIVMPPHTASRLVDGLAHALGRPPVVRAAAPASEAPPAAAQPPVEPAASPATDADAQLRRRGTTPVNAPPDPVGEKAAWLMNAVSEMAPGHYQERSFRIAPRTLLANRFLLSIGGRQLPADALERCWDICRQLGMPALLRPQVEAEFVRADHVHFGFEGEPDKAICKLYLERTVSGLEAARSRASGEPALQYVAFKWNVQCAEHVVSRYHWHAGLSANAIEQRMARLCQGASPSLLEMAHAVVKTAALRLPPERLLYLEVTEAGQPRRSFDLNVYDANLLVRDLQPVLFAMREHFDVRPGQFQALYDQIKTRRMGHLAGGVHRNGEEFFNVYFGGTRQA